MLTCVAAAVAAGFHNASLYEGLRCSIPPLVALLRDDEDKTRANAAGALGNLVRNSGLLCQSLIQANALQVRQKEKEVKSMTLAKPGITQANAHSNI